MKPVWANVGHSMHEAIGAYVSLRLYGHERAFRDYTALGIFDERDGRNVMVAGLVFYDYDRQAGVIQISGAADDPRWLTRKVLHDMFSFPFNDIGCQAVVMRVDPEDKRLGRILPAYGFEKHVLPRLRGRDKDDAVYILFDDKWRSSRFNRQRLH